MAAALIHRMPSNIKDFCSYKSPYIDSNHTKKQTVNIPSSCSCLILITLFHSISQCTLVPYLESSMCNLIKELDNCNFTFT